MKKGIRKMLLAAGLCLIIALQSVSAAQAALNDEACNFCGTRIDRGEKLKLISLEWRYDCREHNNCAVYCAGYGREVYRGNWEGLVHGADK